MGPATYNRCWGMTYMICVYCYKGAQNMVNLINKLETETGNAKPNTSTHSLTDLCKSLSNFSEWAARLTERQSFLHEFVDAYRNQTPFDILLNPGNNGSPIGAHRVLLAARSNILKNMLESDTGKASHLETITLSELNHKELKTLLEFLYHGSLPQEKLEKHIYPLSLAAHKYEIIYLWKFSQKHMLKSLHSRNALRILEISDFCSFQTTRDDTLSFIAKHARDIVFSVEYEAFVVKNPHLSLQITRAIINLIDEE